MKRAAILKAVAEKLIPGIPIQTRISILQQTASDGSDPVPEATSFLQKLELSSGNQFSVLEEVVDRATSRNEIQREIDGKITCWQKGVSWIGIDIMQSFKRQSRTTNLLLRL